jgi:L-ascorbate metabolism protein UlaG (beta-lactamase superfamily)
MKITKYEHACVVIEEQGKKLVIDPGVFTSSLSDLSNICGIVVTHVHPDHFNTELIDKIQAENPGATVYTVQQVADELGSRPHEVVSGNVSDLCDVFHLSFFGGQHAIIHKSLPVWQNVGVLVNEKFYYPGDSFDIPEDREIHTLAVPSIAPWMKISEAIDFITAVRAKQVFPTHNAMLSDIGHQIYNPRLEASAQEAGGTFSFLKPGESLDT